MNKHLSKLNTRIWAGMPAPYFVAYIGATATLVFSRDRVKTKYPQQ